MAEQLYESFLSTDPSSLTSEYFLAAGYAKGCFNTPIAPTLSQMENFKELWENCKFKKDLKSRYFRAVLSNNEEEALRTLDELRGYIQIQGNIDAPLQKSTSSPTLDTRDQGETCKEPATKLKAFTYSDEIAIIEEDEESLKLATELPELKERVSIQEIGSEKFFSYSDSLKCSHCFTEIIQFPMILDCSHIFHGFCFSQEVNNQIEAKTFPVTCPCSGCEYQIEPEDLCGLELDIYPEKFR